MKIVRPFGLAFFISSSVYEPATAARSAARSLVRRSEFLQKKARSIFFCKRAEERSDIQPPKPSGSISAGPSHTYLNESVKNRREREVSHSVI